MRKSVKPNPTTQKSSSVVSDVDGKSEKSGVKGKKPPTKEEDSPRRKMPPPQGTMLDRSYAQATKAAPSWPKQAPKATRKPKPTATVLKSKPADLKAIRKWVWKASTRLIRAKRLEVAQLMVVKPYTLDRTLLALEEMKNKFVEDGKPYSLMEESAECFPDPQLSASPFAKEPKATAKATVPKKQVVPTKEPPPKEVAKTTIRVAKPKPKAAAKPKGGGKPQAQSTPLQPRETIEGRRKGWCM